MDEFLRDISVSVFKEWILFQKYNEYQINFNQEDPDKIYITTEYGNGTIIFNDYNIIEFQVINTLNNETEFYLHFQMKTMKHALELFYEMLDCLKKLVHRPITKILLSCSGGLTTSFFASKMNDAARLLFLNYHVEAIGYNQLFDVGNDYDIIMLAPQISFMHAKVQEILSNQIVINIPPQVFAKYDVGKMIAIMKEAFDNKKNDSLSQIKTKPLTIHSHIHCTSKVLSLSIIRNSNRIHISYRLYGPHNHIIIDKEIIKNKLVLQDICDVIDTILVQHPDTKKIGISLPGIITDNLITSLSIPGLDEVSIDYLKQKYIQKMIFTNDVNAVAVGYYASQKEYQSLSVLFQPTSFFGGAGTIINGQLICGPSNLAGEVQYLPLNLSDKVFQLNKTPEGTLELVSKIMISIISIINPEAIILFSSLIPQTDELKEELTKYIPQEYIPHIIKIDNLNEYSLLGSMILCAQSS